MINLLPDDHKANIRAGRLNIIFLNYIIMTLIGIGLMTVLIGLAFVTLSSARQQAQGRVTDNQALINQYNSVKQKAEAYRSDLATAKQILNKSVNYSDLLLKIAATVPPGVIVNNLVLDAAQLGTPTTLNVNAKSQADILTLKDRLQSNPNSFSDVSMQQITIDETDSTGYPYAASLSVTINKGVLK